MESFGQQEGVVDSFMETALRRSNVPDRSMFIMPVFLM